jgi:hypothetical protein
MPLAQESQTAVHLATDLLVAQRRRQSGLAILVLVALLVIATNGFLTAKRLAHPSPNSPWDAGIVMDAYRWSHGLPVYTEAQNDHATIVYGPLVIVVNGLIFHLTGTNNLSPRVVELFAGLSALTITALLLVRERKWYWLLVAIAIGLVANSRTGLYFTETRPDSLALAFGVASLFCWYKSWRDHRSLWFLAGNALIVIAFLFKQPSALFSLVPFVATLLLRRRKADLLRWCFPPILIVITIWVLKVCFPLVYAYMVHGPGGASFITYRLIKAPLDLLSTLPLFFMAITDWAIEKREAADEMGVWLLSATAVFLVGCTLAAAHPGGSNNSFMPALWAISAFCMYRLHRVFMAPRSSVVAGIVGSAILCSSFAYPNMVYGPAVDTHGDVGYYHEVINTVRDLPGRVVSPEDPTIAFYAKHYVGRNILMEVEHVGHIPDSVLTELQTADYIVQLGNVWGPRVMTSELLTRLGCTPDRKLGSYTIWRTAKAQ